MSHLSRLLWLMLGAWLAATPLAWSRSFPATPDGTEAAQHRWGSTTAGYIADGCWQATGGAATGTAVVPCRAFALDLAPAPAGGAGVPALKGFQEETAVVVPYGAGDGRYWLGGRTSPGLSLPGWTCLAGRHYCTRKQDPTPEAAPGLVLLGQVTVSGGVLSGFSIWAPWRRTVPYHVPASTTLTFGVCPVAGPVPLWQALNDGLSGRIEFDPWACPEVYPEWWGADPTGQVDATLAWRAALNAVRQDTPVACTGTYAISATATTTPPNNDASNNALTLIGFQQIRGKFAPVKYVGPQVVQPCRFEFTGTGNAIGTIEGTTHNNIVLENLYIWDKGGEGNRGLDLWQFASSTLQTVQVNGFRTGLWLGALFYYSGMRGVELTNAREYCADLSGNAFNGTYIEISCDSQEDTLEMGIRLGSAPGLYGTGNNTRYDFLIETSYGRPLSFSHQTSFDLTAYIEQYGTAANHDPLAAATFAYVRGGDINIRVQNSTADSATLPVAIRVLTTGGNVFASKQLRFFGHVAARYVVPLQVDADDGTYGIDASQLAVQNDAVQTWGLYSGGWKLHNNVFTAGGAPLINQGRGSTTAGTVWRAGDVIWQTGGTPSALTNVLRIATEDGNPPALASFMLDSLAAVTIPAGATTPSVKTGQVWNTRFLLDPGNNISDFLDEIAGQCITLRALGTRTITSGSGISLPGGSWTMTADDTLTLCIDGGVWRQYSRADYP